MNPINVHDRHSGLFCWSCVAQLSCSHPRNLFSHLILSYCSMSVTQAMEWLIEHVDDPSVDAPLPGQDTSGAAGAMAAATPGTSASGSNLLRSLSSQSSTEESSRQDELTEIFKRIRRKREFRPDSRVCGFIQLEFSWSFPLLAFINLILELTSARL